VSLLPLDPDQLLSTTRAVRKRLDFTREVPRDLVRECVAAALQAPTGSNVLTTQFVVVTDEDKRREVGRIYGEVYAGYRASAGYPGKLTEGAAETADAKTRMRVASSADYLGEHMGEAPVLVLSCSVGPNRDAAKAATGNVMPATWSFMLAARARGLGTAWTSMHLSREKDVADVLGIPFDTVAQAVLTPLAFTKGTDFKPADRPEPDAVIHWDTW
jgi:nitroreductase